MSQVTDTLQFFQRHEPHELTETYGSPLYVYNERIFRKNCRDIKNMCPYSHFQVYYSIKANSNLTLLKIAREEGIFAEAVSEGEVVVQLASGYRPDEIFLVVNNVSEDEMRFAIERNILLSVDSLSQLARYGRLNPGGKIALRFNPGIGGGHHENVTTGGENTKFGINECYIPDVMALLMQYNLQLAGINQHIGSQMMDSGQYLASLDKLLTIARQFDDLSFIDFGGGFGIPYHKQDGEQPADLKVWGQALAERMTQFAKSYGKPLILKIEPGRYIPAESGVLLGTVHAVKNNGPVKYVCTDIGFNILIRPTLYDSHHDIEVYSRSENPVRKTEIVHVVGNICETGDYIARDRMLPIITEGDVLGVLDAGAYGYAMSSPYNNRRRPAEILIRENNEIQLIRRRDTYEDLMRNMLF